MSGSVLVEGVFGLMIFILAVIFQVELIRAAQTQVILQRWCFHYTRSRALSEGELLVGRELLDFGEKALGAAGKRLFLALHREVSLHKGPKLEGRVVIRHASLFPWAQTRFQMTKRCRFPFSY